LPDWRLSDIREIAVAPLSLGKAQRALDAFGLDHGGRARPFRAQALALAEAFLEADGAAVGAQAFLREPRDGVGQCLSRLATRSVRDHALAETDAQTFVRRHFSAGQNHIERSPTPDNPRQPHRAPVVGVFRSSTGAR